MGRHIRVKAIRKKEPVPRLYVLALIALARQLQEEDEARAKAAEAKVSRPVSEPVEEASQ